jgi:hypothetical protein
MQRIPFVLMTMSELYLARKVASDDELRIMEFVSTKPDEVEEE